MKILIVDDKKENLYLLERIIMKMGYEVVMAENGEQALEKLNSDNFIMVISDILMPVMDGYQLCKAVKSNKKFKDMWFVFYTATYIEKEDEEFAFDLGADKFLRKPLKPEKFLEIIKNLIQKTEISQVKPSKPIIKEEKEILKLYSERLIHKLEQKILSLEKEITQRKEVEDVLRKREYDLGERFKELTCLYNISKLVTQSDISFEQIFREIIKIIPLAWQFPEVTCARIFFFSQEFKSENFMETSWKQQAEIKVNEKTVGKVEVYYLKEMPEFDEGPFLKAEKDLITAITEILGGIIERNKAEQKLKESEKKYRHLIETSSIGIIEVEMEKRKVSYVNPKFMEIIGYTIDDLKDEKIIHKIIHSDDIKNLFKTSNEKNLEFRIHDQQGNLKWLSGSRVNKYNDKGELENIRIWVDDITEKKELELKFTEKLEQEVKMRTQELNQALELQKLYQEQILKASQFKSEFMASMSHELRTPLNSIIGFTDILLEGYYGKINEKQDQYLNDVRSSGAHLLDLINKILDISKIEAGEIKLNIEEIQLKNVINQVKNTIKPMYKEKKLKFEIIGLDEEKVIQADLIRFKEILYNLFSNAVKYTKEGGFKLEILEHEHHWEFNIIDTGIGIAKEDFDLIFKEFKRVECDYVASVEGTGLGLSLTKKLINLHGGNISFTSELGKGTTFTFTLPKR